MSKKPASKAAKIDPSIIATKTIAKAAASEKIKANIGVRGPKGVALTAAITLLTATNPKRAGSKSYARFAVYADGMSVQAALDGGVITPDLVYDAAHGFIAIEGYAPELLVRKEKAVKEPKAPKAKKVKSAEVVEAESELAAATVEETID